MPKVTYICIMSRTIVLFGVSLAILLALLKWLEYQFFARDLSLEMYKNPVIMAGITLMEILPVGLLITLISSFILKKK
jgi:hypothetical protein